MFCCFSREKATKCSQNPGLVNKVSATPPGQLNWTGPMANSSEQPFLRTTPSLLLWRIENRRGMFRSEALLQAAQQGHHRGVHSRGHCTTRCPLLETNLASRWDGVRLPRASGKSPDFPGSSPNFPGSFSATSLEDLSLWNLTAIQGSPEVSQTSPEVPQASPEVSRTSPEVSPFLWEA